MKTIRLEEGKYEIDVDDFGSIVEFRRNGEHWPVANEYRFSKLFGALASRVLELEECLDETPDSRDSD